MKYLSFFLIVSIILMTGALFAEEYEVIEPIEPIGNGAIYNATSQTISLHLAGGNNRYHRVLKPGEVLLLQKHPKYSVGLNNSRDKIALNVEAFVSDDDPWSIRWHHIAQTGRNSLTIKNGLPQEWTVQIASEIKKSIKNFGLSPRLIPISCDQDRFFEQMNSKTIDKNQLIEDICARKLFEYLSQKLPAYFIDAHGFPFTFTEVYNDAFTDNPALLFFICSGFSAGSDEMLEFVSRVLENALPDDYGHYQKLKGIEIRNINYEAASALRIISSLRGNDFGMILPKEDEPCEPAAHPRYSMGRLILKQSLYSSNPDETMARVHAIMHRSLKDTGLIVKLPNKRNTWWDHTFFEVTTQPVTLKTQDFPLATYNKYSPRVSLCWDIRVTRKRRSSDKPVAILNAYTIFHLTSNDESIDSVQNVHVDKLPVEHFGIKTEAAKECEDISVWLGRATMDFMEEMGEVQ